MAEQSAAAPLTRNQQMVLDLLIASGKPLAAYNMLEALRSEGLRAPPQVYRALERLQSLGLVHRVESLNAFVACDQPHAHATCRDSIVLAVCNDCHTVTEISGQRLKRRLAALSEQCEMGPEGLVVEMRGQCARCKPKSS